MKAKIAVAMSGGVDSSLTALLLMKEGYEVVGITLELYVDGEEDAADTKAVRDARAFAEKYGIEHHVIHAKTAFKESVVDYFLNEYKNGRTPNPCVFCNKNIKFKLMLEKALELGCEKLVTGHYAQVRYNEETKLYELHKGADPKKDQSYVLYTVDQHVLEHVLFPIGHQHKTEVRSMASALEMPNANQPDSLDICFLPDNNYQEFVEARIGKDIKPGEIVHIDGTVLGKHTGIHNYTIGQRKGLGIAYAYPLYVVQLDGEKNRVIVGPNDALFSHTMIAKSYNFVSGILPEGTLHCEGKIRYAAQPSPCDVKILEDGTMEVTFEAPQRAITPGQSVVLYDGTQVLGGGIIDKTK